MGFRQILLELEGKEAATEDYSCPDCDCALEMSYTGSGRMRLYCDNCDSFVPASVFSDTEADYNPREWWY